MQDELGAPAFPAEQPLEKIRNQYEIRSACVRPGFLSLVYGATIRDRDTGSTKMRAGRQDRPAAHSSSCSHAANEQASRQIRFRSSPRPDRAAINVGGSLAARSSRPIRPVSSTTQIAVSSKEPFRPKRRPARQNRSWLLLCDACGDPTPTTFSHPDRSSRPLLDDDGPPITRSGLRALLRWLRVVGTS